MQCFWKKQGSEYGILFGRQSSEAKVGSGGSETIKREKSTQVSSASKSPRCAPRA